MSMEAQTNAAVAKSVDVAVNGIKATEFIAVQADGEWLARVFLGANIHNAEGQTVGAVSDLVFDHEGQINSVVVGVGGFLGMGEKSVAIPFKSLAFAVADDGDRIISVSLSRNELMHAPTFQATEKTTFDNVREIAVGLGSRAADAVVGLKDQAVKKIGDMNKDTPKPQ